MPPRLSDADSVDYFAGSLFYKARDKVVSPVYHAFVPLNTPRAKWHAVMARISMFRRRASGS